MFIVYFMHMVYWLPNKEICSWNVLESVEFEYLQVGFEDQNQI